MTDVGVTKPPNGLGVQGLGFRLSDLRKKDYQFGDITKKVLSDFTGKEDFTQLRHGTACLVVSFPSGTAKGLQP